MYISGKKAESMIEVIVASLVIIMAATSAAVLLTSALSSNVQTRDRMRAVNLAKEGIEAMINIRDTNLLKSGAFKQHCWNFLEDPTRLQNKICNSSTPYQANLFISETNSGGHYLLTQSADYMWYVKKNATSDLFNSVYQVPNPANDPTEFFRTIDVEYYQYDPTKAPQYHTGSLKTYSDTSADIMKVTVTVGWRFKGQEKTLPLTVLLTNHRS